MVQTPRTKPWVKPKIFVLCKVCVLDNWASRTVNRSLKHKSWVVVNTVQSKRPSLNCIINLYILNGETGLCFQLMTLCCKENPTVHWTVKESWVQSSKAEAAHASSRILYSLSAYTRSVNTPDFFFCVCNMLVNITSASTLSTISFHGFSLQDAQSHFLCK